MTCSPTNPLFQPDLFLCILDCITLPATHAEEARSSLVRLAQTCRTLSEPSLDRLWSKLDSLKPLIRCYATVVDEERVKTPPSSTEWAIIRRYSHRIKEVDIVDMSSLLFLRVTSFLPSLLVPNLRVLRWHPFILLPSERTLAIVFIQQLLSPSLVHLVANFFDADDAILRSFIANCPILCPNLKSIIILWTGDQKEATCTAISRAISRYEHLEHLDISIPASVDAVALMHIATSSKLRKVEIHLDKSDLHQFCIPSDVTPFRNVEDLALVVGDISFVLSLLRPQEQAFRSFTTRPHSRPTPDVMLALFTTLASSQHAHSLRSVHLSHPLLDFHSGNSPPWENQSITRDHLTYCSLRPLTSLRHLRTLFIESGCWFSLDDDELLYLTRNWPRLRHLHLNCSQGIQEYPWRWTKYATFKGLLSLLENCPELEELCLPLDARQLPTETPEGVCHSALANLYFPESPIGDADLVHDLLTRHLPSIDEVCFSFDLSSAGDDIHEIVLYVDSWSAVNAYLRGSLAPDPYDSDTMAAI